MTTGATARGSRLPPLERTPPPARLCNLGHHDWTLEDGMVVSAHLQMPGDARHRSWLEEIFLVTRDGGEPFFTWGNDPIAGGAQLASGR